MRFRLMTAALAVGFAAAPALAQDATLAPSHGETSLAAGFTPSPHVARVWAGAMGEINAAEAEVLADVEHCAGFITEAPNFVLNFEPADAAGPLSFSVRTQADPTLVVATPDGDWLCADDILNDAGDIESFEPVLAIAEASAGRYAIWVGVFHRPGQAPADLTIWDGAVDPAWIERR